MKATAAFKQNGWDLSVTGLLSELYVFHNDGRKLKFVARFKYAKPSANARHFIKFLTSHCTPEQFFANSPEGGSEWLRSQGYVSYNEQQVRRRG